VYKTYISDSLLLIQKSLGVKREDRYYDYVGKPSEGKQEERTDEEIIQDISKKVRGY